MFYKKGVLKSFAKLKGKHLSESVFLIKLQVGVYRSLSESFVNFQERLVYRTPPGKCFCQQSVYQKKLTNRLQNEVCK